ncbi:MAG: hypothetical protein IJX47_02425 [Clostridia bacterium]|nr:hypothetical protein [Clostridia bacterium]
MSNTITVTTRAVRDLTRACEEYFRDPANVAAFEKWKAENAGAKESRSLRNPNETDAQFIERMSVRYHKYDPRGAR